MCYTTTFQISTVLEATCSECLYCTSIDICNTLFWYILKAAVSLSVCVICPPMQTLIQDRLVVTGHIGCWLPQRVLSCSIEKSPNKSQGDLLDLLNFTKSNRHPSLVYIHSYVQMQLVLHGALRCTMFVDSSRGCQLESNQPKNCMNNK